MPRKKAKIVGVPILFLGGKHTSPHVLNLREKLNPALEKIEWQPSHLAQMLSEPIGAGKKTQAPAEKKKTETPMPHKHFPEFVVNHPPRFDWSGIKMPKLSKAKPKRRAEIRQVLKIRVTQVHFMSPRLQKVALGFVVACLVFVLPLKTFSAFYSLKDTQKDIVDTGTEAFNHLELTQQALAQKDMAVAMRELQTALELFSQSQNQLDKINPLLKGLALVTPGVGNKLRSGENLMLAGTNLTLAALPALSLLDNRKLPESLGGKLDLAAEVLKQTAPRLASASNHLMAVDPQVLPAEQQEAFLKARENIFFLNGETQKLQQLLLTIGALLGKDSEKNYLLVFQNNNEIRPTGGFIGSFAEARIKDGKFEKLDLPGAGSYQLQGSLKVALQPPAPLQLLKAKWEFQDANWFADYPTSAKKIAWFYAKSGGPSVDGVIALNTNLILDFLKITGPIEMPQYKKIITADNFIAEIQKQVEIDYDKTQNKPKQILADLMPLVLEKIMNEKNNFVPFILALNKNLNQKNLLVYLEDQKLEKEIIAQGWGGEIKDNKTGDYLAVVNTNIAGGKTDGVILQTVEQKTVIGLDGTVINTVKVKRTHNGDPEDTFTKLQNVDYIRFYVPAGSELLAATGFDWPDESLFKVPEKWYQLDEDLKRVEQNPLIDNRNGTVITTEYNKTVFANWVLTKPGQTSEAIISYRLPFKVEAPKPQNWQDKVMSFFGGRKLLSYSVYAQSQPGMAKNYWQYDLSWPVEWNAVWADPAGALSGSNNLNIALEMNHDNSLNVLFEDKTKNE